MIYIFYNIYSWNVIAVVVIIYINIVYRNLLVRVRESIVIDIRSQMCKRSKQYLQINLCARLSPGTINITYLRHSVKIFFLIVSYFFYRDRFFVHIHVHIDTHNIYLYLFTGLPEHTSRVFPDEHFHYATIAQYHSF